MLAESRAGFVPARRNHFAALRRGGEIARCGDGAGDSRRGTQHATLTAFLDEWRVNKAQHGSKKAAVRYWLIHIAVIAAIAAVVFAAGYFSCWINIHAAADADG